MQMPINFTFLLVFCKYIESCVLHKETALNYLFLLVYRLMFFSAVPLNLRFTKSHFCRASFYYEQERNPIPCRTELPRVNVCKKSPGALLFADGGQICVSSKLTAVLVLLAWGLVSEQQEKRVFLYTECNLKCTCSHEI
jgi:hypothetical protein